MSRKLLLIDGSSVLSTSFFGSLGQTNYYRVKTEEQKQAELEKLMKTSDGRYTNGVYTMTKILLNIFKKVKPTHMAICWDVNRESLERKKKFDGYKSHRKDTIPQLGAQFGLMQDVLNEMNIPQFKLVGHEADDIIGTFAKSFEKEIPTFVYTKDQDALQLVSEHTRIWLTTSKAKDMYQERGIDPKDLQIIDGTFEFTPLTFEEEYGIKPIQIIDMKALEGDTSDNIPGVAGVGPASVGPLLREYGSIEGIYEAIENNPEDELKTFFKEELGIKQSPIAKLLKKKNIEIAEEIQVLLEQEIDKKSIKEIHNLFKLVDDKSFKEKVKVLNTKDENSFKEQATILSEELKTIDNGVVGKEAAFLSKELATIQTNLAPFNTYALEDLEIHMNTEKTKAKFEELEFKSLIDKI